MKWRLAQWCELRWWKKYLQKKDPSQYREWKKEYWRDLLQFLNIDLKNKEILDLACGPSGIFILEELNYVTAIDPLLDEYQKLGFFKKNTYPSTQFHTSTFEDFNFTQKFDVVFALNALNHFKSLDHIPIKLANTMQENGLLFLSVDLHRWAFLKWIFRIFPGDILHPQQHDRADYLEKFEKEFELLNEVIVKKNIIFEYRLFAFGLKSVQQQ